MKKSLLLFVVLLLQLHAVDPLVERVLSIQLTVSDMDQSVRFYTDVLNFEKLSEAHFDRGKNYNRLMDLKDVKARVVQLKLGNEYLVLKEFLHPKGRTIPKDIKNNDPWYHHIAIVVNDIHEAFREIHFQRYRLISSDPQTYPASLPVIGGISVFYFKDPDGHPIAIIQYPPDKGARKWHLPSNETFLGIDHTAIVVNNIDDSLNFYQKLLGLKVTESVLKHGIEQENLTQILGIRLRTVMLRPKEGPGIELMEYLHPPSENIIKDTKTNDIWYEQINTVSEDLDHVYDVLKKNKVKIISHEIQNFNIRDYRAFVAQDPDGHAILFSEKKYLRDEKYYLRKDPGLP